MIKVSFIGNLGKDPEPIRYTPEGKAVCSYSVAVTLGGGENKQTLWYRCSSWEKQAENDAKYLAKGSRVYIEGVPVPDKTTHNPKMYTNKENAVVSTWDVTVKFIEYLSSKSEAMEDTASVPDDQDVPF
jgi:single stranded DNA-binding protein